MAHLLFGKRFVQSPPQVPVYNPLPVGFPGGFFSPQADLPGAPRFIDGATAGVTPGSCI